LYKDSEIKRRKLAK
jgi:hypothetical protein